MINFTFSCALQ